MKTLLSLVGVAALLVPAVTRAADPPPLPRAPVVHLVPALALTQATEAGEYAPERAPESATSPGTHDGSARVVAYLATGIGVVGVGVGAAFGVAAIAQKIKANKDCDGNNVCGHKGLAAERLGQTYGDVATATLAGGAAMLGTGVLLLVAPPRALPRENEARSRVRIEISPASAALVGSF